MNTEFKQKYLKYKKKYLDLLNEIEKKNLIDNRSTKPEFQNSGSRSHSQYFNEQNKRRSTRSPLSSVLSRSRSTRRSPSLSPTRRSTRRSSLQPKPPPLPPLPSESQPPRSTRRSSPQPKPPPLPPLPSESQPPRSTRRSPSPPRSTRRSPSPAEELRKRKESLGMPVPITLPLRENRERLERQTYPVSGSSSSTAVQQTAEEILTERIKNHLTNI